ncbi:MAG TPA: hypothetical protein VNJ09_08250, partial [Chthonomonadales bacterium]|nr:hypothetical protein [Chthonomonadales bacterium]
AGKTLVTATHDLSIVPEIADRVFVLNEQHSIERVGSAGEILADMDLLLGVNLIHEHGHYHRTFYHSHPHYHGGEHEHEHGKHGTPQNAAWPTP